MSKLKLKESLYVLEQDQYHYLVIFTSTRRVKKFKVDSLTKKIIDFSRNPFEESLLVESLPKFSETQIKSCIDSLKEYGIIRELSEEPFNKKQENQIKFLDELTSSREESLDIQHKIENTLFSVFGVGGIGTWIVNGLNQLGVKKIRICDPDKVEDTNLNRQLFFDSRDMGNIRLMLLKKNYMI